MSEGKKMSKLAVKNGLLNFHIFLLAEKKLQKMYVLNVGWWIECVYYLMIFIFVRKKILTRTHKNVLSDVSN